jgi:small GTP-binding protein
MGSWLSQLRESISRIGLVERRVLMLGLDNAGKTTILFQLKLGQPVSTVPTVGFNVETVRIQNMQLTITDVGGQTKLRPLWRHYFYSAHALIYVVDSSDKGRIEDARVELEQILDNEDMAGISVLVFANKQDLEQAMSPQDVAEGLRLNVQRKHPWFVQGCVAPEGRGLGDGFEWLRGQLGQTNVSA